MKRADKAMFHSSRTWRSVWSACMALVASSAAAQDPPNDESIRARYLERLARLDKIKVVYSWSLYVGARGLDPFNRSLWGAPKLESVYDLRLRRPDFHFATGPLAVRAFSDESSWVDGIRIRKSTRPDGFADVGVDNTRFSVTGPVPFLTPLEVFHTFDVQHSLAEMWSAGLVRLTRAEADTHFVSGAVDLKQLTPGTCSVEAQLDARTLVPRKLSVTLHHPRGTIEWHQVVLNTKTIDGAALISEAVITLTNNVSNANRTTLYHFKLLQADVIPQLQKDDLKVVIPDRSLNLVDEVGLGAKRLGPDGTVMHEERWTPEQRAADLAGAREIARLRGENFARLGWRKTIFMVVLVAATGITILAGGLWWRRRAFLSGQRA